jgi:rSAM/selenodomain-associated transferase 1
LRISFDTGRSGRNQGIVYRVKNENALIIIAKSPETGHVKTRLNSHIPEEKVVEIYAYLLEQTVRKLRSIEGVDTFIAHAPYSAGDYFMNFGIRLIPLHESDLGAGMYEAFRSVFNSGYRKTVLVGADIPDLSSATILDALHVLSTHDLVFGPARDGGYYLVGMRKLIKEVFEKVPWSSDQTLEISLRRSKKYNYSVGFTETLSDIDTIDDVQRAGLLSSIII